VPAVRAAAGASHGNRWGDTQHTAHRDHRVDGLIRAHELEPRWSATPVSVANQAAAFDSIALFARHPVLAPQPIELVALTARQPVTAQTFIDSGLPDSLRIALADGPKSRASS
jgi:hypothetical protein